MSWIRELYRTDFGLLTDLYQLTMADGYWQAGLADREAIFHLSFRRPPFGGGYAIACGTETIHDLLANLQLGDDDLEYLRSLTGNDGQPLFSTGFLASLYDFEFACDVDAVSEGTAVFAHEPLVRVRGPLLQCQLIETMLLCVVNFQTLIATKAARICDAAQGEPVLEFGLRRAQGIDGGLSASRAAFVGGCAATSNVLAGKLFGIPVKGTHAHSWVMAFPTEQQAFAEYASAMPNNCIFLVDTYDTEQGVAHAIEVGRALRERGHEMVGIRLDSGDLAELSIIARRMLDEAGFPEAAIVASNDLDEETIASLKQQDAQITVWGVGTNLVTGADQPALGGVYKLSALKDESGAWVPKVKLSEQAIKTSTPGCLQVKRFSDGGRFLADAIYNEFADVPDAWTIKHTADPLRVRTLPDDAETTDLLQPMFQEGRSVWQSEALQDTQARTREQLAALPSGTRRLLNPHEYTVGYEESLADLKRDLILAARQDAD